MENVFWRKQEPQSRLKLSLILGIWFDHHYNPNHHHNLSMGLLAWLILFIRYCHHIGPTSVRRALITTYHHFCPNCHTSCWPARFDAVYITGTVIWITELCRVSTPWLQNSNVTMLLTLDGATGFCQQPPWSTVTTPVWSLDPNSQLYQLLSLMLSPVYLCSFLLNQTFGSFGGQEIDLLYCLGISTKVNLHYSQLWFPCESTLVQGVFSDNTGSFFLKLVGSWEGRWTLQDVCRTM